jgi:competence ComEA-like helix-hairpin-helix protein
LNTVNQFTGNAFPAASIERLLREFDGMVVLDEAYIDFAAGPGFLARLGEFGNLIVLQTLSKAWGMAGLRLGLAFASEAVAGLFARVKYPYNINSLAQQAVAERLTEDISPQVAEIRAERDRAKQDAALARMESGIRQYEAENKTGNPVLDTLLTAKSMDCQQRGIGSQLVQQALSMLQQQTGASGCVLLGDPAKAKAIIDHRSKNGPFKSVDDLKEIKGFGDKVVNKMRPELTVAGVAEKSPAALRK